MRQKKKKEKASKQPTRLAVEVSFADDPDREKVGGFDAIDEGDVDMADLSMARPERSVLGSGSSQITVHRFLTVPCVLLQVY